MTKPHPAAKADPCLTPGCVYSITVLPHYHQGAHDNARIDITVRFPAHTELNCPGGYEGAHMPWGVKERAYHDAVRDIMQKHLERAISEVGQFDLSQGGTMAKDWPLPPPPPAPEGER